jgi:large subunit ribosomal protein L5
MTSNPTAPLVAVSEHLSSVAPLHQTTLFPYVNTFRRPSVTKATVAFSFRSIDFQKKRALPFFIAIELLTQQKCVASLARRNVLAWKIRKGRLVGCRVTLRRAGLFAFLDTLQLALPRREKLAPPS